MQEALFYTQYLQKHHKQVFNMSAVSPKQDLHVIIIGAGKYLDFRHFRQFGALTLLRYYRLDSRSGAQKGMHYLISLNLKHKLT